MKPFIILLVQLLLAVSSLASMNWNEAPGTSVLLRDVDALTLYRDRYTTGRRSSPVPQLKCVGGSAGCGAFVPQVVQCINKGWDGVGVQWQCKADMANSYRFGQIEVSCEGYSHPKDAYILTGSCGLAYKLELTEEGRKRAPGASREVILACLLGVVVLLLIAFAIYQIVRIRRAPPPSPHYPGANPPPAYGVDPGYGYGNQQHYPGGAGCAPTGTGSGFWTGMGTRGYGYGNQQHYRGGRGTGSGFWTGMGTGGMLGYLFGSHRRQPSSYGGPTGVTIGGTGTHISSGFGGTTIR